MVIFGFLTFPSGINYYDKTNSAFSSYINFTDAREGRDADQVWSILEDRQGNLWLGTNGGGLVYFDRTKQAFTTYTYNPDDPSSLSSNAVLDLFEDDDGSIWIGTWGWWI